jgi:hypothetical protein
MQPERECFWFGGKGFEAIHEAITYEQELHKKKTMKRSP